MPKKLAFRLTSLANAPGWWHAVQSRLSRRRARNMSWVLRPPCLSTVRTIAGEPVLSARCTSAFVTFQSSVGYNMNQEGHPCALFTSAMLALSTVERIIWCLRLPAARATATPASGRSEEHTSELQSRGHLVCRLLLEKKKQKKKNPVLLRKKKKSEV